MAALRSRCGHYIFALWFLSSSSFFYSSPRCGLNANLGRRSETCCTRLAGNAGPKKRQKFAIWAPSHNFVGLYLRNKGMYRQSEKNLLNNNMSPTCPHDMVNFGPLASEICWRVWDTPANFNGFRFLAALLHGTLVWRQPNFAALNRGHHL